MKITTSIQELGSFIRYHATNGSNTLEFFTNRNREGRFYWNRIQNCMSQSVGTLDFSMPVDDRQARAKVIRMFNQMYN